MKLYYFQFKDRRKNFGDELNLTIWNKIFPNIFDSDENIIFVGIGTLINREKMPCAKKRIIFSSGVGYGTPPKIDHSFKIYCLRGKLSAKELGVPENLAIADGAILMKDIYKVGHAKKYKYSFMPHNSTAYMGGGTWKKLCMSLKIFYIDPLWPIERIIRSIIETEVLITEALHGAIVADTFRTPWIPVKTTDQIYEFKWHDWLSTTSTQYFPARMLPLWDPQYGPKLLDSKRKWIKFKLVQYQLLRIIKSHHPNLTAKKQLNLNLERLREQCDNFISDYKNGLFSLERA